MNLLWQINYTFWANLKYQKKANNENRSRRLVTLLPTPSKSLKSFSVFCRSDRFSFILISIKPCASKWAEMIDSGGSYQKLLQLSLDDQPDQTFLRRRIKLILYHTYASASKHKHVHDRCDRCTDTTIIIHASLQAPERIDSFFPLLFLYVCLLVQFKLLPT